MCQEDSSHPNGTHHMENDASLPFFGMFLSEKFFSLLISASDWNSYEQWHLTPFSLMLSLRPFWEVPHLLLGPAYWILQLFYVLFRLWSFLFPFLLVLPVLPLLLPSWTCMLRVSLPPPRRRLINLTVSLCPHGFCSIRTLPWVEFLLVPPSSLWLHVLHLLAP